MHRTPGRFSARSRCRSSWPRPRPRSGTADKPTADSSEKHQGVKTILLVEDAEPLRKLAQSFLETNGFRVLSAASGEDALEIAARHSGILDLLLTDVVMPGMNGRALAGQLLVRQPGLKVLFMSGYTDSFIAGHGVLEAGTNLLHKPFTEEVLVSKVHEVLQSTVEQHPATKTELHPVGSAIRSSR